MPKRVDIHKIKAGNIVAFRQFFYLLYPKLTSYASRFVDTQDAKDLVQDLFASYWEKKEQVEADDIIPYLYRWLHNSCLNHVKHRKVVESYQAELHLAEQRIAFMEERLDGNDIFRQMEAVDLRNRIEMAVNKLPPRSAEAFRLRNYEDLSHKDIAERMNISVRTVEWHLGNAISILRVELQGLLVTLIGIILCNLIV